MFINQNLRPPTRSSLFGLLGLAFIVIICTAFDITPDDEMGLAKREILLRRIGHELLLQSGDSTSRVLPVKKISEDQYQISFENEFTFEPSVLVQTTSRVLAKDPLTGDYVVNVLNCGASDITYGYTIAHDKKDDIIPCTGRLQPKACYIIDIKFSPGGIYSAKNLYLLGGLPLLAFVGFIFFRSARTRKNLPDETSPDQLHIGSVRFDVKNQKLIANEKTIDLTGTESRLLLIFAQSPDEIIERSRLQKEIWEDHGIIVGRSLDMFISKLRKKLEIDLSLKIVVVRGKGYRLEVG